MDYYRVTVKGDGLKAVLRRVSGKSRKQLSAKQKIKLLNILVKLYNPLNHDGATIKEKIDKLLQDI